MVRVDSLTYVGMGAPKGIALATQLSAEYTFTRTMFVIQAGPVLVKATFLSPLTPVAHAIDLGPIGSEPIPTLFTIGLCQDPAIQFLGQDGLKDVPPLWKSYFVDDLAALSFFHKDYSISSNLSTLDSRIASDSHHFSGANYATITSLSACRAFGAAQLVGTSERHLLFLKEISSNGNTQTVDVIYPTMPVLLYTNHSLLKLTLDPLFENQEAGHYPRQSAMHDLGEHYPRAVGHTDGKTRRCLLRSEGI